MLHRYVFMNVPHMCLFACVCVYVYTVCVSQWGTCPSWFPAAGLAALIGAESADPAEQLEVRLALTHWSWKHAQKTDQHLQHFTYSSILLSLSLLLYCIALQCTFEQCCFNLISKLHYTKPNWTSIEQDWINMNKTELYQTTLKKINSTIPKQNWIHPNLN